MNYEAKPHRDKNNVGESLVVAWGDYTGGELVTVADDGTETEYNIAYKPVIMDASKITHYVKPITSGTRYSVIFFKTKMTNAFYKRYGKNLNIHQITALLPEKLPGQKNSEIRIPI
jgi:predicted 2-oxoglutarate/Fe(II)-dependent dioxygenase YbiX